MKRCETEGCDHPAEPRGHLCPECWLAFADFLRDQERDAVDFSGPVRPRVYRLTEDEAAIVDRVLGDDQ